MTSSPDNYGNDTYPPFMFNCDLTRSPGLNMNQLLRCVRQPTRID